MLGPEEDEFDVVVFRSGLIDAKLYQANQLAAGRLAPDALQAAAGVLHARGHRAPGGRSGDHPAPRYVACGGHTTPHGRRPGDRRRSAVARPILECNGGVGHGGDAPIARHAAPRHPEHRGARAVRAARRRVDDRRNDDRHGEPVRDRGALPALVSRASRPVRRRDDRTPAPGAAARRRSRSRVDIGR